jgi:rSAM/selenodomain-associated transferase 2
MRRMPVARVSRCATMAVVSGPAVSVVVPVLADGPALERLLAVLHPDPEVRLIVVNGGAVDAQLDALRVARPDVRWLDSPPGRGVQVGAALSHAAGAWLLVLHADTRLPDGWRDELAAAGAAGRCWGCFRLRLDTSAWQARLIEGAVRVRVRLFRLPYGDQGMFFDRPTLVASGGVPAVPLMEDVLLARRFARLGPPYRSRQPALTSARRWERDGWWRRTARNWWTCARFLLGVSPDRLAAAYVSRGRAAGRAGSGTR